jgi:malonyl-ACP decarboxylase
VTGGVAVTGMAVLSAAAEDLDSFARFLRSPGDEVPAAAPFVLREWVTRHLADDPAASARLIRAAGRSAVPAQTAAAVAVEAVRAAGTTEEQLAGTAVLVAGNNLALAYQAEAIGRFHGSGRVRAGHVLDHLDTDAVGAVSEATGVRGEGWTVGAASASGTVAVIQGVRLITSGAVQRCLVVGPLCELSALEVEAFTLSGAMTPAGVRCLPFDQARRGFVHGPGAAAVMLERRDQAGDRVLAGVVGYGLRLDAHRGADPDSTGQIWAMRRALSTAGVEAGAVDLVNAHATGSVIGDQTEACSIADVFGEHPVVNSTKALIGHGLTCAGLLELIAVVAQIRGGFVHGNPHLRTPLDVPLRFAPRAARQATVRLAMSNSFAFSGINASLLIAA